MSHTTVFTSNKAMTLKPGHVVQFCSSSGEIVTKVVVSRDSATGVTVRDLRWYDSLRLCILLANLFKAMEADARKLFPEFEPNEWADFLLMPYHLARYVLARIYSPFWYAALSVNRYCSFHYHFRVPGLPLIGGRRSDPDAIYCPRCLWAGMRRSAVHTYTPFDDEVEPVDECPRCGEEI